VFLFYLCWIILKSVTTMVSCMGGYKEYHPDARLVARSRASLIGMESAFVFHSDLKYS